jgi:quinol monooxygenase YgiN
MTAPGSPLVVVAVFAARPGREAELQAELSLAVGPTRAEPGCLRYELNRATNEPGVFFFTETWASAAHHAAHLGTAHIRRLLTVVPAMLAGPIVEHKGELLEG